MYGLPSEFDRFYHKVLVNLNGCWEWQAALDNQNYGAFWFRGKTIRASRAIWLMIFGPTPSSLFVCHKCDNKLCVRLDHLFLGTIADNTRDMYAKGLSKPQRKTHCKYGHALTIENTIVRINKRTKGINRECKECHRRILRESYARKKNQ